MSILTSMLAQLLQAMPQLRPQLYFKSSLTALSHAMEDQVLAGLDQPLVIASFQRERFYRQEAHRYRRIADRTSQVYVMAAPESEFKNCSDCYETVAFEPTDQLSHEWHLIVIAAQYASCLICRERPTPLLVNSQGSSLEASSQNGLNVEQKSALSVKQAMGSGQTRDQLNSHSADQRQLMRMKGKTTPLPEIDPARRFEGVWTFDREVSCQAAALLLDRILHYRPELAAKIEQARLDYGIRALPSLTAEGADQKLAAGKTPATKNSRRNRLNPHKASSPNPDPFVQRLVTYLQAGQYKLLKAYESISAQERKERLVNSITGAMRHSLKPDEILQVAVQELGQALMASRCLIYRCKATDASVTIQHEFLDTAQRRDSLITPALGQTWPLQENSLFQEVVQRREQVMIADTQTDLRLQTVTSRALQTLIRHFSISSWLMVPVLYQDRLLGMVELHHCTATPDGWEEDELALMEAVATQLGAALIQAEAYANMEDLNQQLEALDRTRSNLVAITGHELRTPLSTIQVCLESLASEPDMSLELRQVMLNTAMADAERMRKLVQDFLTLSRLESGRVQWHPEPLFLQECVELALSSIRSRRTDGQRPQVRTDVSAELPLVRADGEWLVEVLAKLLDNACKFTTPQGQITIQAECNGGQMLEVTVEDTGRGIEPNRLETVFDRFYQEEGALRRTTGGTGLGLAICRQIVSGWGGQIWAESAGKDQGSKFHFTVPIAAK